MKKRTKNLLAKYGMLSLALFLLVSATLAMLAGRYNYRNYWGGVVFAPFAILLAIALIGIIYRETRGKNTNLKGEEELFEGPLKDWRKW